MPCDQVITAETDLKFSDRHILRTAAEALGITFVNDYTLQTQEGNYIRIDGARASCRSEDLELVEKLRTGYANECIKVACKKFGWRRKVAKEGKYVIQKGH